MLVNWDERQELLERRDGSQTLVSWESRVRVGRLRCFYNSRPDNFWFDRLDILWYERRLIQVRPGFGGRDIRDMLPS